MIPYLSTFEQIQQEAQKLVNLKIKDIRCLDEEVVINIYLMQTVLHKNRIILSVTSPSTLAMPQSSEE